MLTVSLKNQQIIDLNVQNQSFIQMDITDEQRKWCIKVINHLFKWKLTVFFRRPIDPAKNDLPNYFQIVQKPMDLETVKKTLLNGNYKNIQSFISDLQLIFENAKKYHGKSTVMWFISEEILQWISKMEESMHLTPQQIWFNELAEIKKKIEDHVLNMPSNFQFPKASK